MKKLKYCRYFNNQNINFFRFAFLLTIVVSVDYKSQTSDKIFDSVLINTPKEMLNKNISREKIIKWNEKMLEKAIKNGYQKGIIWVKINLGSQYHNLAKPDLSLKYINEAKILADNISADNETYAYLFLEYSRVYYTLGLYDLSLKYNERSLYFSKKMNDGQCKKENLKKVYGVRAINLIHTKSDSALYYLHKSSKISENIRSYADLGSYYISIKPNLDSAKFYLRKARTISLNNKEVNKYDLSVLYFYYGRLCSKEKKYTEAIKYLEKSLLYASYGKNRQHLLGLYNLLAETYRKIGDTNKEKKILEDYKKFNESFEGNQTKTIQLTIENLEKEASNKDNKLTDNVFIYSLFLVLITGSITLFSLKKKKKNTIPEENINPEEYAKPEEHNTKSTISLDDLYQSALSRDPSFYTKFQEYYPDFAIKLLSINGTLQNSELELLAYIYLKLETKAIANILFLSPKTIQNRKYNIRKKLNIPTCSDFYIWLISLK